MALVISVLDVIVSAVFTIMVARQYLARRKPYQLIWTIALAVWTIGVLAETVAAGQGAWAPLTYRLYYAAGALMVAAWLGVGSLFLVASRRVAMAALVAIAVISVVGVVAIMTSPINPADLAKTDSLGFVDSKLVKVFPLMPVRLLIIISNIFGTFAFVGGALFSVYQFWRKHIMRDRMVGVLLIAVGGLIVAGAHSIGVLGGPALFRISELLAVVVIFAGFLLSSVSTHRPATSPAIQATTG
ncbi:MAG TPA: hypothetical protein DEP84_00155 [Chloroflexi bacterium]|nr:hypothetical protein [Chloroflexota bacterium]